jgi:hypothetical protein
MMKPCQEIKGTGVVENTETEGKSSKIDWEYDCIVTTTREKSDRMQCGQAAAGIGGLHKGTYSRRGQSALGLTVVCVISFCFLHHFRHTGIQMTLLQTARFG